MNYHIYVNIINKDTVVSGMKFRLSQNLLRWAGGQIQDFCLQNLYLFRKAKSVYILQAL